VSRTPKKFKRPRLASGLLLLQIKLNHGCQGDFIMPITYDKLVDFVAKNDNVRIYPSEGVSILKSGEIDYLDLIDKATQFGYQGKVYSRQEFEKLVEGK
jgi:hypothetical protein